MIKNASAVLKRKKEMASSSRILIVENNSLFSASLCQQLALEGFKNVIEVGSLANFDDMLRDVNPDLVLLSIQMPDGNSVDICRKLRSDGFFKSIIMLIPKVLRMLSLLVLRLEQIITLSNLCVC